MMFQIRCEAEGVQPEVIDCVGDVKMKYWPTRFAVDAFIAKHDLLEGEKISVSLVPDPKAAVEFKIPRKIVGEHAGKLRTETFVVRTRTISPIGGKASALRFGELDGPLPIEKRG